MERSQISYSSDASPAVPVLKKPIDKVQVRVTRDAANRANLIKSVRFAWINGVLKPAQIGDVWLDLLAEQRPEHVEPEIQRKLDRTDYTPITLDSATLIVDVFRKTGRALLILGAPGSGKTMTLLELASGLLDEAELNDSLPVPVVLNLASWAIQRPARLEQWLIERMTVEYGMQGQLAQRWIDDGNLLFLFDGLDELPLAHRAICIEAINGYWGRVSDWKDNGIVVASRREEYQQLVGKLRLDNAILLQPLTPVQATDFLSQLGQEWEGLRSALPIDQVLRSFSSSPLLLNIMAAAYRNVPFEQLVGLLTLT